MVVERGWWTVERRKRRSNKSKIWEAAEKIWKRNTGWLTYQTRKDREKEENDDRRQTWIISKSNEKHTLKLNVDPTHLVRLRRFLSSAALKKPPARMKIQVIKMWRGSSPSHPQPADSVQTDIGPVKLSYLDGKPVETGSEEKWNKARPIHCVWKVRLYSRLMNTLTVPVEKKTHNVVCFWGFFSVVPG